jgi:hypothetical protein
MITTELQKFGSSHNQVCKIHLTPKEKKRKRKRKKLMDGFTILDEKITLKDLMDGFSTLEEKIKIKKTLSISFHILPI